MDSSAESAFNDYPLEYRKPLLQIRELVYSVAAKLPEVGPVSAFKI